MKNIIAILLVFVAGQLIADQQVLVKNQGGFLSSKLSCVNFDQYALWLGSDKGINRLELQGDSVIEVTERRTSKPVLALTNDGDFLWVGIKEKGLYLFNKKTYEFTGKFKKDLGKEDLVLMEKVGKQLNIFTKSRRLFIVDLQAEILHEVALEKIQERKFSKEFVNSTKKGDFSYFKQVNFNDHQYFVTQTGLLVKTDQISPAKNEPEKTEVKSIIQKPLKTIPQQKKREQKEQTLNQDKQQSSYWLLLFPALILYTLVLVKLVSNKYKKDIRIIEEELLSMKKKN